MSDSDDEDEIKLYNILHEKFGHKEFRSELQKNAIKKILTSLLFLFIFIYIIIN